jgi:hypothetical protein
MNGANSRCGNVRRPFNRNYNPFDPLMDQNIVCYKCNNLGHKARDCREMKEDNRMPNVPIVRAAFVFLARLKFHVLMLEIKRWFLYSPSVVSKSLKSYHASSDDYRTLEASSTFWQKYFPPFVLPRNFTCWML